MAAECPLLRKLHDELKCCLSMFEEQGKLNHDHFNQNVVQHLNAIDVKQYTRQDLEPTIDLFKDLEKEANIFTEDIKQLIKTFTKKVETEAAERRTKPGRDQSKGKNDSDYYSADSTVFRDSNDYSDSTVSRETRLLTENGFFVTQTSDDKKDETGK